MLQQTQLVIAERNRLHFCWGQPGSGDGTDGSRAAIDCDDWNRKPQLGWYPPDLTNSFCFGSEDFIQECGRRFVTESGTCMEPATLWSRVRRCNHWQYTCTCCWQFSYTGVLTLTVVPDSQARVRFQTACSMSLVDTCICYWQHAEPYLVLSFNCEEISLWKCNVHPSKLCQSFTSYWCAVIDQHRKEGNACLLLSYWQRCCS